MNKKRGLMVILVTILSFLHLSPAEATSPAVLSQASQLCDSLPTHAMPSQFSNADFIRYGLPIKGSMSLEKWQTLAGNATHHICGHLIDSGRKHALQADGSTRTGIASGNWSGNVADGTSGPYTEADTVYYVPQVNLSGPAGYASAWVGLGGYKNNNLTQTGIDASKDPSTGNAIYDAWVENLAATYKDSPSCGPNVCILESQYYPVSPGDRIQVQVSQNYMYIGNGGNGTDGHNWTFSATYGPYPNNSTAEWLVEDYGLPYRLDNFGSVTFYGMGDTQSNGAYTGPYWQTHDYFLQEDNEGIGMLTIGPLQYNTTFGPPNDSNTITWISSPPWP
jgi:hypothetical protein